MSVGIWEQVCNPDFNYGKLAPPIFDSPQLKTSGSESDVLNVALFGVMANSGASTTCR